MTRTAHDGTQLPAIGLGTYKFKGSEGAETISRAISTGYVLLDSAFNYENEGTVGDAVRRSGLARENLIVTSKLPGRHHGYDEALVTIQESVYRTGFDYIDLYLIHWPNPLQDKYVEAWRALIEAKRQGWLRSIGVSNFLPEHVDRLERETGILPAVNQIELHPYFPQEEQVAYDASKGIITEAWSPLGRGNDLLVHPVITSIADAYDVTPGQVVLAWGVARGVVPIPKASSLERQAENLAAVDIILTTAEVESITALGRADGRLAGQDPRVYEEF